jgi:hypothetical protein
MSSRSDKHEMQMIQKRLLRIIGINTPEELKKYNIASVILAPTPPKETKVTCPLYCASSSTSTSKA